MKSFNIPGFYKSGIISKVKELRRSTDPRKKDYSPTLLDFGPVKFYIARHFGFCYGVENAIEISFKAVEENPHKRIFLLSQMIHNPEVNSDLVNRGVKFLMDTNGKQIIPFEELKKEDIVIIPAFGTTLAIEERLQKIGIAVHKYDTTCPFVERVWKKAERLGEEKYTVIIHGKHNHEETRATFSRSEIYSPAIIIKNMREAEKLGDYINGNLSREEFDNFFSKRTSSDFDPEKDLVRVGVINQTTMLASETQDIADYFREVMEKKYGASHFADTRDTLCYATNENQEATLALLDQPADIAIVVGGYNSSNTSHIVELCEQKFPTYFISSETEITSKEKINHFDFHNQKNITTGNYLTPSPVSPFGGDTPSPSGRAGGGVSIILTSGASCPDAVVERVMMKMLSYFENVKPTEKVMEIVLAESQLP
ncbi:MAG: 4-hydroxy-3-methylbut-2-enyl diphosphate reductase [Bacteroidetes bacterium]|nr:MAG: 4-hydroxy-3-methylbut-2-enyl diphosphate reductase [Bacteroidota bacterium]